MTRKRPNSKTFTGVKTSQLL